MKQKRKNISPVGYWYNWWIPQRKADHELTFPFKLRWGAEAPKFNYFFRLNSTETFHRDFSYNELFLSRGNPFRL